MQDLPYDIWALIASFIPNPTLQKLCSVNRAFFDVAINQHYRELSLENGKITTHLLADLKNFTDAALAQRVRSIRVDPVFLETLLDKLERDDVSSEPRPKPRWREKVRSLIHLKSSRTRNRLIEEDASCKRRFADLILGMANVKELSIQSGRARLPERTLSIFELLWPTLGPGLRKLTISCKANAFEALSIPFPNDFACLEELVILIKAPELGAESLSYSTTMHRHVAPFISRTKSTLRSLLINCADPKDLSLFFSGMGCFPHLTALDIQTHISKWNNGDALLLQPSTLVRFLELNSSTLEFLRLPPTHMLTTSDAERRALSNIALPHVKDIRLIFNIAAPSIELLVLKTIRPIAASRQLQSLNLPNYALTLKELDTIASAFKDYPDCGLRRLKIKMAVLTPEVLDLLWVKIPGLKYLNLDVDTFAAEEHEDVSVPHSSEEFLQIMASRKYSGWALSDLSIFSSQSPSCQVVKYHRDVMNGLAKCIPSLTSFMGQGHMNMDVPLG